MTPRSLRHLILSIALGVFGCRQSTQTTEQVCAPVEFRACDAGACRGVQQCLASGSGYGACSCVVLDSGFSLRDGGGGIANGGSSDASRGGGPANGTGGSHQGGASGAGGASNP